MWVFDGKLRFTYITEAGDIPVHGRGLRRSIDDGVAGVVLPGLPTVCAVGKALRLCVWLVWNRPANWELAHRGVHQQECAILLTLEVDSLAGATEDAQTVVASIACRSQSQSFVVLPAIVVRPYEQKVSVVYCKPRITITYT